MLYKGKDAGVVSGIRGCSSSKNKSNLKSLTLFKGKGSTPVLDIFVDDLAVSAGD